MKLGNCIFDDKLQTLKNERNVVLLARKPSLVLRQLLAQKNELVTREVLIDSVWDGRTTSLSTMNQTIYLLRKAFKALNDDSVVIKSIRHSGYVLTNETNC